MSGGGGKVGAVFRRVLGCVWCMRVRMETKRDNDRKSKNEQSEWATTSGADVVENVNTTVK